jgi:dipeptidyl aminopeptidase/acylaminoacyl peptidase
MKRLMGIFAIAAASCLVAAGEGHGFQRMENKVMFYGAMEKFLDENIGH